MSSVDISIVVPCYNEADNAATLEAGLLPIVAELARKGTVVELIFVDDGSTDGTAAALKETFSRPDLPAEVQVIVHPRNRGVGAALRTGFQAARGQVVVTTDSDGTYRFAEIPNLLSRLTTGIDIVTASPYHPDGGVSGVPAYRLILSQGSSLIYRVLASPHIHTYTALFRAYRREVIENVSFASDGFLGGTELLVKAIMLKYQVAEYPAVLYVRTRGSSKARIWRMIRAHLGLQKSLLLFRLKVGSRQPAWMEAEGSAWIQ